MTTVLMVVHIVLVIALILVVLVQKSEGGALGMGGGGMGGFMNARGTANFLTRATGILATLFFLSSLGLAILFKGSEAKKSILDDEAGRSPLKVESTIPVQTSPQMENAEAAAVFEGGDANLARETQGAQTAAPSQASTTQAPLAK